METQCLQLKLQKSYLSFHLTIDESDIEATVALLVKIQMLFRLN